MDDEGRNWKKFQKMRFDSRDISRRMKRAETASTRHARKFIFRRIDNIREARRQIVSWLVLVGVMIVAVSLQLVWFQQSYQTVGAAEGGTYAEGSLGPVETLNPLYASSEAEVVASRLLFSSLYSYDTTGHLKGDLATKIERDETGKIYTITMRDDAQWSDDTLLSAADVAFTIDLIKNPATRSPLRVNWQDISVKALDETRVQFTLPAVYAAFPHALTFSIVPKHLLETVAPGAIRENGFSQAPLGSGPFVFRLLQTVSIGQQSKTVHLVANERYYGGLPKLARFEVHAYKSAETITKALKSGEINAAASIPPADLKKLNQKRYQTSTKPIDSGVYGLFNNNNQLLKDKEIRSALRSAVDVSGLRSKLNAQQPALDLPFINGQLEGADVPTAPAPNVVDASARLDKAGWVLKDGMRSKDGIPLRFTVTTTKDSQYEIAAKYLADSWRKIGVDASVSVIDTTNPSVNFIQDTLQPRNFDVLVYELIIGADPDVYAYWHSSQAGMSGYNLSNYSNPIADATLSSARSRTESDIRQAKYKAFAKQWLDDVPAIGLYQPVMSYAHAKQSRAFDQATNLVAPTDRFANVLYWSVDQKSVYKTP